MKNAELINLKYSRVLDLFFRYSSSFSFSPIAFTFVTNTGSGREKNTESINISLWNIIKNSLACWNNPFWLKNWSRILGGLPNQTFWRSTKHAVGFKSIKLNSNYFFLLFPFVICKSHDLRNNRTSSLSYFSLIFKTNMYQIKWFNEMSFVSYAFFCLKSSKGVNI